MRVRNLKTHRPEGLFLRHGWDHEPGSCLTLTRNLNLTLRSSITSKSRSKSKKSSAAAGVRRTARFMESPLSLSRTRWDHEPPIAWSSGFSWSGDAQPPKGGTPYQRRFMESPLGLFAVHWDHEPRRCCRHPAGRALH